MQMAVYFDNAATTAPSAAAIKAFNDNVHIFGNPSSPHAAGTQARFALENARKTLASLVPCKPQELVFTSCGSESNNMAMMGAMHLKRRHSKRIVLSDSEHASVAQCAKKLASDGAELVYIPTRGGVLDLEALAAALSVPTALVCVMHVNNETGAEYDLQAVRTVIDRSGCGALFHCDAVQGFLKTKDSKKMLKYPDTVAFSAHKLHALRGIGALAVRGIKLPALIHGGGQEKGLRSGTENVLGACVFAAAAADYTAEKLEAVSALRDYIKTALSEAGVGINEAPRRADGILSISLFGVKSETALNFLSQNGVYISASSACSTKKGENSVLRGFGLEKAALDSALRIGISPFNTLEEAQALVALLLEAKEKYARI